MASSSFSSLSFQVLFRCSQALFICKERKKCTALAQFARVGAGDRALWQRCPGQWRGRGSSSDQASLALCLPRPSTWPGCQWHGFLAKQIGRSPTQMSIWPPCPSSQPPIKALRSKSEMTSSYLINAFLNFWFLRLPTGENQIGPEDSDEFQFFMQTVCLFLDGLQERIKKQMSPICLPEQLTHNSNCVSEIVSAIRVYSGV